jgi:FeS assembly protein IscX
MKWTWQDVEDLGRDLAGQYPDEDPLRLSTKDVRRLVISLPTFDDEADAATESLLESIQAAWYENRER